MIKEILKLIDAYWKFDEAQQPMSSWHDKQDLLVAIEQLKNCNVQDITNRTSVTKMNPEQECGTPHYEL